MCVAHFEARCHSNSYWWVPLLLLFKGTHESVWRGTSNNGKKNTQAKPSVLGHFRSFGSERKPEMGGNNLELWYQRSGSGIFSFDFQIFLEWFLLNVTYLHDYLVNYISQVSAFITLHKCWRHTSNKKSVVSAALLLLYWLQKNLSLLFFFFFFFTSVLL